jgi:2-aminoethylphosphonate-pyruvate transaminase
VSSIAGEELDLAGWGIDLIVGSANKCIRGVPGVSFVVASNDLMELVSNRRPVAFYSDLVGTLGREENGETPFTPPVQTMYALREALKELMEEGVEERISHYRGIAETLRDGLSSLELDFLVARENLSNTMTSVVLPEHVSYADLHGPLKDRGYLIYKSQGVLSKTTFRLGTVGVMTQDDIRGFLLALKEVLGRG